MPATANDATSGLEPALVVVPADLTLLKVNGGRGFSHIVNWDHDADPAVGQHLMAADGGSERLEAVIVDVRANGTLVLQFP